MTPMPPLRQERRCAAEKSRDAESYTKLTGKSEQTKIID